MVELRQKIEERITKLEEELSDIKFKITADYEVSSYEESEHYLWTAEIKAVLILELRRVLKWMK